MIADSGGWFSQKSLQLTPQRVLEQCVNVVILLSGIEVKLRLEMCLSGTEQHCHIWACIALRHWDTNGKHGKSVPAIE